MNDCMLPISHREDFKLFYEYASTYLFSNTVFQADEEAFLVKAFLEP